MLVVALSAATLRTLTFSRRSLKAMVRSPCQAVRMCIYGNECSASLYPTVIKNIIKESERLRILFVGLLL